LEDFSGKFLKKTETFFLGIIWILCETNPRQVMPSHNSSLLQKIKTIACHVLAAKSLSLRQKWTGNNYYVKILLTEFNLKVEELQHTLLIEKIGLQEEVFAKMGSFEFSVTLSTSPFYL